MERSSPNLEGRKLNRVSMVQAANSRKVFALIEPDEGDTHNVFVDGMLMSPGSEDYKVPPPEGLLDEFRRFLDSQSQVVPQHA